MKRTTLWRFDFLHIKCWFTALANEKWHIYKKNVYTWYKAVSHSTEIILILKDRETK